jgi:threonine-phosphate decarboxylase
MTSHGGNRFAASQRTGIPEDRILDFSASISPFGMPEEVARLMKRHARDLPHYPEPFSGQLSAKIEECFKLDAGSVICGNGSTELIYLIPRALKPGKVLIPAPTFSEYEKACSAGASRIVHHVLPAKNDFALSPDSFIQAMSRMRKNQSVRAAQSEPPDMAFLCNPNHPTGQALAREEVVRIAAAAKKLKCRLVVDEAFAEFCPRNSVIEEVQSNPYLIVLRSMTKFYALAGLRLGYCVASPAIATRIKRYKEPWTVNTLAQKAGIAALEDVSYRKATLKSMGVEKRFIEQALRRAGIEFIPSQANYYLLRLRNAREVIAGLEQKGILVRDCSNFTGMDDTCIRIAVRSRKENRILMKEMTGYVIDTKGCERGSMTHDTVRRLR